MAILALASPFAEAALTYIGDASPEEMAVTAGTTGPDGANGGVVTYAFFSAEDIYTNTSGASQLVQIAEVNFNSNGGGTLTPFVAVLLGGGAAGADYNVLAVGDAIAGTAGLNNAPFEVGGATPTITLNDGESLVAGFHQSTGMIKWNDGGDDGDYLSQGGAGGNTIPGGGTGALTASANWSTLDREYRFNIAIETDSADRDGDGIPDAYEDETEGLDADNPDDADDDPDLDTLTNLEEFLAGTDINKADTDDDTLRDDAEIAGAGVRPPTSPTNADTDGDGLSDASETNTGTYVSPTDTGSNPTIADSDGDGLSDSDEVSGNNQNNFFSDPNLADTDGDGFDDPAELGKGTDPNDSDDFPIIVVPTGIFIGDVPDQLLDVGPGSIGPDGANGGIITYAFFNDPYLNEAAVAQSFRVTGVNYQATVAGTLTPFVALLTGAGGAGADYDVLAVGDPIDGVAGLNNAEFLIDGENPVIKVESGEQIVGGFHQTPAMVRWEEGVADADYISSGGAGGNTIPPEGTGPLTGDAGWTTLGREYAFNIELQSGSGPAPFKLDVKASGSDLVLTWDSADGRLYNVRSQVGLDTDPLTWPIFGGFENMEATPPENSVTFPRPPGDPERFFVIEEFPAPPEVLYGDNFENGQGDWTFGNDGEAGTNWELGAPGIPGPDAANSPTNCFGTNLASNYELDANAWLRSPAIDLTTAGGATVNYFNWVDVEGLGFDFGTVSVLDASDNSVLADLFESVDVLSGWVQVSKALPAEALGKVIKIEFRLISDDFPDSNFPGWYIDDFEVTVP